VFFTAMESAEQEFLRNRGLGVVLADASGELGFPRVSVRCDYRSPLRFDEVYQIEVRLSRIGSKSLTFEFRFRRGEEDIATGEITSVCCRMTTTAPPKSIEIPEWILQRLREEPAAS
jgi:acyl-CoA thioester hydrolase